MSTNLKFLCKRKPGLFNARFIIQNMEVMKTYSNLSPSTLIFLTKSAT